LNDGGLEGGDAHASENREGELGANAGNAVDQEAEEVAFLGGDKSIKGVLLLPDVEVGEQKDGFSRRAEPVEGRERHDDLVAHAVHIDRDLAGEVVLQNSAQKRNHR